MARGALQRRVLVIAVARSARKHRGEGVLEQ